MMERFIYHLSDGGVVKKDMTTEMGKKAADISFYQLEALEKDKISRQLAHDLSSSVSLGYIEED